MQRKRPRRRAAGTMIPKWKTLGALQRTSVRVIALAIVLPPPPQSLSPDKAVTLRRRKALPSRPAELMEEGMTFLQMRRNPPSSGVRSQRPWHGGPRLEVKQIGTAYNLQTLAPNLSQRHGYAYSSFGAMLRMEMETVLERQSASSSRNSVWKTERS